MSDIFNVSPPAWLQDLTRSNDKGLLGGIAGELLGGGLIAAKKSNEPDSKSNWFQSLPQSIAEAHLNFLDPTWKIKVQQGQLNIAHTALGLQEMQQKIGMNATQMKLRAEDLQTIPKWLQDHPTYESRRDAEWPSANTPEWNKNLDQMRLRDSQSEQAKIAVSGIKAFTDRLSELSKDDREAAAQISSAAQQYTQRGQPPTKELTDSLALAEQTVSVRKENERKQQEATVAAAITKAEAGGETVRRTFGPKGESVTVTSGAGGGTVQPQIAELGGHKVIYNPKGGGFKVLSPEGQEKNMTPAQLKAIADMLDTSPDSQSRKNAATLKTFLTQTALKQIAGEKPATPAAPKQPTVQQLPPDKGKLVKGTRYFTSRGVAEWDGAQFMPVSE